MGTQYGSCATAATCLAIQTGRALPTDNDVQMLMKGEGGGGMYEIDIVER